MLGIDKDVFEDILKSVARQPNLVHVLKLAEFWVSLLKLR